MSQFDLSVVPLTLASVRAEVAIGVPLLIGFGGGVNSIAALILIRDYGLRPDLITFADTGGEKPETYAYFALANAWLVKQRFPQITVVKKKSPIKHDNSLEEECLRRETLPSRAFGLSSCAQRWKIEPQEQFLRHWEPAKKWLGSQHPPIKVLGYDGGEERRTGIYADKMMRYWYPLFDADVDRDACVALIQAEKLPVPPKSACFFCPSSKKGEVLALKAEHPELFERALRIERTARTSERHELRTTIGLGRTWTWAELVEMSAAEFERQLEQPVESCMICSDGEVA